MLRGPSERIRKKNPLGPILPGEEETAQLFGSEILCTADSIEKEKKQVVGRGPVKEGTRPKTRPASNSAASDLLHWLVLIDYVKQFRKTSNCMGVGSPAHHFFCVVI